LARAADKIERGSPLTTISSGVNASVCRFEDFELDCRTLELRKAGVKVKLAPQPARVLALLARLPGELVTRSEIHREVWGETTFVDFERNLNYCMNCIRAVLGDTVRSPRFIETLPRRGYRFIPRVQRDRPFSEPVLAVLPFANLNADPSKQYFADGITDALITELACIPVVRVISRQSVLHLKGSCQKMNEIARELNVDAVVEGAVQHEGDRVRVTAQLILLDPERHIWARTYDCDLSAILRTQSETARAIAACVVTTLRPGTAVVPGAAQTPPAAPDIVETYLKARIEFEKMSAEGIGKALCYFKEITVKAPEFVLGLVGHATCLWCLGFWGHAPTRDVYARAKQLALQAIAIDDNVGKAHQTLAWMNWLYDEDLAAAEREFRRAIELSPGDSDIHLSYATFLSGAARHSEAIAEIQYALALNCSSLLPNQAAAWLYLHASEYVKAEAQARRTTESFPNALQPHFVLGWATWRQGRVEESVAAFEKALSLSREPLSLAFLGHIYARIGRTKEAECLLHELEQLRTQGHAPPMAFVVIYAGFGDADAAFDCLETAYRLRCDLQYLTTGFPGIDPLRPDPRFVGLVRRMGIVWA
jgi:TolB-like protein/tetratricopeptide (TPR) repeat protein